MENIKTIAINTYLENIEFLKNYDNKLYNRIINLSSLIDSEQYKENYYLEYIQNENQFDIYNKTTNSYIYNKKPSQFIRNAVSESNFDKDNSIDIFRHANYNSTSLSDIDLNENMAGQSLNMCKNDIFEYTSIFQKTTLDKNVEFKKIEKFLFAGTLLGTHIPYIIDKFKLDLALIYEYNLEIFRLSLFTTNYAELSKRTNLIFSIADNRDFVESNIIRFLYHSLNSNYMVKYYSTNYNIHDIFERILSASFKINPFSYNYWRVLKEQMEPSLKNIIKYPVLDTLNQHLILKNKEVLIVSAGPSFGKNIDWIKKHQNNYFIIAVGAAVSKLINNEIKIDLITSLEGSINIKFKQFPDEIKNKISQIPLLAATNTHNKVLEIFSDNKIILFEAMTAFKSTSTTVSAYSVGETTLWLAGILGANKIYLLGADLALDQETGASHISDHKNNKNIEILDETKQLNAFVNSDKSISRETTVLVKGNFREQVVTTTNFSNSIQKYDQNIELIQKRDPNAQIFNLNDGAYFKGAISIQAKDIIPSHSNISYCTQDELISSLYSYSQIGFSDNEIKNLKGSLVLIDTLINKLIAFDKLKVKSYDQFSATRIDILNLIAKNFSQYKKYYLDKIFMTYFFTIEHYIGYHFNTKDLNNEANNIKKVKKVWIKHMLTLAKKYKELIESINK